MMNFSVSTLLSSLLFANLMIMILWFLLKNNAMIQRVGIFTLITCIVFILFRMLVPFEFGFAINILDNRFYPIFSTWIRTPLYILKNGTILMNQHLLLLIWIVGIFVCLSKTMMNYRRLLRWTKRLRTMKDIRTEAIMTEIQSQYQKQHPNVKFKIVQTSVISTPIIYGLKSPTIVLPQIEFSDDELYYVLSHEAKHYYNKDLWQKWALEFLRIFYWWNPLAYLLKNRAEQAMEIHADLSVTKHMDEFERISYLDCILKIFKINQLQQKQNLSLAVAFVGDNKSNMRQRFKLVLNYHRVSRKIATSLFAVVFLFLMLISSFAFIVEPTYEMLSEHSEGCIELSDDNAYLVDNMDETYKLYIFNEYVETIYELDNTYSRLPIYKNESEVLLR